ncbi:uncharacterized protein AMSG_09136 [Thecamonas trahens ATCC 50062]|uniref:N-acetyltransferase domain-containing protein n=1 Tax=Thecamonas trahens ATCC 50062 TaxID=461836 RepID=A0A0L0DL28_THETB|nr:hypothetical protein AMSG_09136 [Thecamonas trahens ATCC 50062]KNC52965.1 hypothetical protein AMSG_09136 [Thecamonas trahens ATCC 50062]|eukprot:XP_013754857.1 hypothetical protein AMSG_09136 [Thecamonas trahens ATCC 50062]
MLPRRHGSYVLRAYDEACDDGPCRRLEERATQGSAAVRVAFVHASHFAAKARQFEDAVIVVAAPDNGGDAVGVVSAAIKRVYLSGTPVLAGYVFDLRVEPAHTRRGLATALMDAIEDGLAARGIDVVYLTVNSNNHAARALYARRSYSILSQRALSVLLLLPESIRAPRPPPSLVVVDGRGFRKVYDAYYGAEVGADFALVDPEPLLNSPYFLEGYTLTDETSDSFAALALFNGNGLTSLSIERLLLPMWLWRHNAMQILLALLHLWIVASAINWFWASGSLWRLVGAAAILADAAALYAGYFVLSRLQAGHWRARFIAPVASGPRGQELLAALVKVGRVRAHARGFALVICNMTPDDVLHAVHGPQRVL